MPIEARRGVETTREQVASPAIRRALREVPSSAAARFGVLYGGGEFAIVLIHQVRC